MPDMILAPDELGPDYHLALTATYTAVANGVDTNSASARLSRHGQAVSGKLLSFSLSGDALFTEGGHHTTVSTDVDGEATVYFTDTRPEMVKIDCHYHQTSASADAIFQQDSRAGIDISAELITNHSPANGITRNALRYSVYDTARKRVPSVALLFSQDGNATLLHQIGQTNNNGQFTLELTSFTAERIRVTAKLQSNPLVANNTFVYFDPAPAPVLKSNTITNYALANGFNSNRITFTLDQGGIGVPNQTLSFTSDSPTATILASSEQTNQNGQVPVGIQNTRSGETTIMARVDSLPSIQPIYVIVTFTQLFRIIYQVIVDRARADGITHNQIQFSVSPMNAYTPLPNMDLSFTATNGAQLSSIRGTTNANGYFSLNLTNNQAGPVRVTATLVSDTAVQSNIDISFT